MGDEKGLDNRRRPQTENRFRKLLRMVLEKKKYKFRNKKRYIKPISFYTRIAIEIEIDKKCQL